MKASLFTLRPDTQAVVRAYVVDVDAAGGLVAPPAPVGVRVPALDMLAALRDSGWAWKIERDGGEGARRWREDHK